MSRYSLDLRLLVPALCAWLAAGLGVAVPELSLALCIALWLLGGLLLAVGLLRHAVRPGSPFAVLALGSAIAALVLTIIAVQVPQRLPDELQAAGESGRFVEVVVETTAVHHAGAPLAARVIEVEIAGVRSAASAPVLLFDVDLDDGNRSAADGGTGAGIGSRLRVAGTVVATEPGDSTAFLLFASRVTILERPPWYLAWANETRAGFAHLAARLPGTGGDLLPGLAIGETSAVSDDLDAAMKASALSHLTAVSGANCAIVIGLMMLAGAAIGVGIGARILLSLLVLLLFVVLVTPEPSVLRAAVMAALVLFAVQQGRPVRGVPVLCLAVIVLLAADPWLSRSYGFGLSVLATGGLLVLSAPLTRLLARAMPTALAAVIAIPLAAQLACQPLLILLDPSVPVYGVIANLLAAPAAPVATVVGLASCALLPLSPSLAFLLAKIAWVPAAWIAAVAEFFSSLPGNRLAWPEGFAGVLLLALTTVAFLIAVLSTRRKARLWGWGLLAGAAVISMILAVGGAVLRTIDRPADWQIAVCDVGQGDAVLVRSQGQVALVDAGPDPDALDACLRELSIGRIDLLVLSHFDLDHVGGASAVFGRVDSVLAGPMPDSGEEARLLERLESAGASITQGRAGDNGMLGELRWTVLWPPARLAGLEPGNAASVAVLFEASGPCEGGCLRSVFLGDLGQISQVRMLARLNPGVVDVVKVSHHGSADQEPRLYEALAATVGAIGVGEGNGYGHPNQRLLELLEAVGTVAVRTDRDGLILLSPGDAPGEVSVWRQHSGDGGDD